jgi:Protein of unknown function (DUF1415)
MVVLVLLNGSRRHIRLFVLVIIACVFTATAGFLGTSVHKGRIRKRITSSPVLLFSLNGGNEAIDETEATACPYSRSYPRYRIYLTSVRDNDKSFVWPWQRAMARNQLERQSNHSQQQLWKEGVTDGVAAVAALWRIATDAIQSGRSVTAAFPDTDNRVIRQWVDLMEWLLEYMHDDTMSVSFNNVVDKIPTVTITLTVGQPQQHVAIRTDIPDHETVTARTKAWVKRVLVNLGICPFTKSVVASGQGLADVGIPVGRIAYFTSTASTVGTAGMCQLQADTWEAIHAMLLAGPDAKTGGTSSILLAAPAYDADFSLWSGPVFCLLEAGVVVAGATASVGVVCFHPEYQTPDGSSFPGFGHMHSVPRLQQWLNHYYQQQQVTQATNVETESLYCPVATTEVAAAGGAWQRRTPHATINVLRADQLAAAEGKRSSPTLYSKNILQLMQVGWDKLQEALEREQRLEL